MPANSKTEKVQEEGREKDALVFTFTNGAKEQIEELKDFFDSKTELDLINLGISILQNYKTDREKEKKNAPNK